MRAVYTITSGNACRSTIYRTGGHEVVSRPIILRRKACVVQGAYGDSHGQESATAVLEFVKPEDRST